MRRPELHRHGFDLVSLLAGLVFLAVSVTLLSAIASDTELNGHWIAPALLVGLGGIGLAGALGGRGEDRSGDEGGSEPVDR